MKYYYDIVNNSIFSIDNFEYTLRDNQDYEITQEEFNNYFDKLNNFYDVVVKVVGDKISFTYTKNETSEGYLIHKIEGYKQELEKYDYISTKIFEAQVLGEDISQLITKYGDILVYRKTLRNQINELEKELEK